MHRSMNSVAHALDHFGLDGAITVVLAVKVLRLVAHTMTSVACNRDLDFRVVWHLLIFTVLV